MHPAPVFVENVSHRYGDRLALDKVSLIAGGGMIFGLLGPNGGGKSTLLKILATLLPLQEGDACILGNHVRDEPDAVRRLIGVTFQSPALDGKLTVLENLRHHGRLYGLHGADLRQRCEELLDQFRLSARRNDRVDKLSGGLKRRIEIAKAVFNRPYALLLDEPSTGLDPGARIDLWRLLDSLRQDNFTAVFVATHLMDEADRCDRIGILNEGKLVAYGSPADLRMSIGGDCLTIRAADPDALATKIAARFSVTPRRVGDALRIERDRGHELLRDLVAAFPDEITSSTLGKPTLEDVFIQRTGHQFWQDQPPG